MQSRLSFVTPPTDCEFLPGRTRRLHYEIVRQITPDEYMAQMEQGWRRFGHALFRHVCSSCRRCQSLRVHAATFRADRSQQRVWRANHPVVRLERGVPSLSPVKQALFEKFHGFQHSLKGWPLPSGQETISFVDNPLPTEEWCYYVADRLVGVGYVDVLPAGLSAIYFYYDPDERHRSLGTFNVLSVIDATRTLGLPHAYLGYYVQGCRSLEYKARFKPNEILDEAGTWVSFAS
jgi:leucyl-tRNA---protein transferase